jgi:hypothetical protein
VNNFLMILVVVGSIVGGFLAGREYGHVEAVSNVINQGTETLGNLFNKEK